MSLIEDALRKAQRPIPSPPQPSSQPSRPAPPSPAAQPVTPPKPATPPQRSATPTASPKRPLPWLLLGAVGAIVVAVGLRNATRWADHQPTSSEPADSDAGLMGGDEAATYRRPDAGATRRAAERPSWIPSAAPALKLEGVVVGLGDPLAVINGTIVRPGETIEGATLLQIGQRTATLTWEGRDVVLELPR